MKYTIKRTSQFKKDFKQAVKRGLKVELLMEVITLLAEGKTLPPQYKDHALTGNYAHFHECHIHQTGSHLSSQRRKSYPHTCQDWFPQ